MLRPCEAAVRRFKQTMDEQTHRAVHEQLRLDYPWLGPCLIECFQIRVHNEGHPDNPRSFGIEVLMPKLAPTGRRPRAEGVADLERAVRWYYRNRVKVPPDSIHDLARDYASWAGRDNDSRSVVQDSIDQVEHYLKLMNDRWVRLT